MCVKKSKNEREGGGKEKKEKDNEHCLITLEKQMDNRNAYGLGFIFIILVRSRL